MKPDTRGFSLPELMIAIAITVGIGLAIFQLFSQNERVFRDQNLVLEMQQTARMLAAQISDEIRMAGQGVPLYSAAADAAPSEAAVAILQGSNGNRIHFRAGLSNVEAETNGPLEFGLGSDLQLAVSDAAPFADKLGADPVGRFVYLWGPSAGAGWGWTRAAVNGIVAADDTLRLTPVQTGAAGWLQEEGRMRFASPPAVSLEEGVAIFFDAGASSVRRAAAVDMNDPVAPVWAAANELAANVAALEFHYYDAAGNSIVPDSLAHRARVARVDVRVVVRTAQPLSNDAHPSYALSVRSIPRNARVR